MPSQFTPVFGRKYSATAARNAARCCSSCAAWYARKACSACARARAATAASSGTRAGGAVGFTARRRAPGNAPADGSVLSPIPMPATATIVATATAPLARAGSTRWSPTAASPRSHALRGEQVLRHRVLVGRAGRGGIHPDEVGAAGGSSVRVPRPRHELVGAGCARRRVHDVVLTAALAALDALERVAGVAGVAGRRSVRTGRGRGCGLRLEVGRRAGVPPGG